MAGNIDFGRSDRQDWQADVEGTVRLRRVIDRRDRAIPDGCQAARVADRNERRQAETVAILTDALILKMTLIPALFNLLGEKTWYIPGWLDRILPNLTVEPPHDGEPSRAPAGVRGETGAARGEA